MTKINYDDQPVGHPKECKNVVGKVTTNSSNKSENKTEQIFFEEDPILSIYQEGCLGSNDEKRIIDQNSHVILPSKKSTKNIRNLQPIAFPHQHGLIPIVNGHEKQKIIATWDSNTAIPSTSNTLGIL